MVDEDATRPCRHCGQPVRIKRGTGPRKAGAKAGESSEARRCDNPDCPVNGPKGRGLTP